MAGQIVGAYGYQRSGKSLISFMIAEHYYKLGLPVYTNVDVQGYNKIMSLDEIPFNLEPKVLWLDEVQYYLDSRSWQDNTESSIFFNTIGKCNILLLMTTIHPDMLEKRIRKQHNYVIMAKGTKQVIYYRVLDNVRGIVKDYTMVKNPELFKRIRYDSNLVPDYVDCDLKNFNSKIRQFNMQSKGIQQIDYNFKDLHAIV